MKYLAFVVSLAAFAFTQPAWGAIEIPFDYTGGINTLSFNNYELVLRKVEDGSGDLTLAGGDFDIVQIGSPISADDYIVTIFGANGLDIDGEQVNSPFFVQEFTGYSVIQVGSFGGPGVNDPPNTPTLVLKAADLDPFGIFTASDLAAEVALKLYADDAQNFTHQSGGAIAGLTLPTATHLAADVASASGGELFASFGFGAAIDAGYGGVTNTIGFWESSIPSPLSTTTRNSTDASSSLGLNVKEVFSPAVVFTGVMSGYSELDHSLIGQSNFEANTATLLSTAGAGVPADYRYFRDNGRSNWMYHSDDPVEFAMVPEPSGIVVIGGLVTLLGVGLLRARRRSVLASAK